MVIMASVLVNSKPSAEGEVPEALKKVPEVSGAHMVHGVYDTIAWVESKAMQELRDVIGFKIRLFDNIRSTLTTICLGVYNSVW